MEFALAHRRLRVQRLSQNAIDSPRFRDLDTIVTRKYMHAETLALLTKPLYFPNMKYLK
jgi:hypothetical protein